MARGYKSLTTVSDGQGVRRATVALAVLGLIAVAAGCGGSAAGDSTATSRTGKPAARCPSAWAAGWQAWTNRIGAVVYCPTFFPGPLTAEIDGQWNTAKQPGKEWQLGYAWLEHDQLVHVIFEGYPAGRWPPTCPGQPCFADVVGHDRIGRFDVKWYDHNSASHWHHLAAAFPANGYVYVISMHVIAPYDTEQKARAALTKTIAGLVPLHPGG
jgi:hypothetical protein